MEALQRGGANSPSVNHSTERSFSFVIVADDRSEPLAHSLRSIDAALTDSGGSYEIIVVGTAACAAAMAAAQQLAHELPAVRVLDFRAITTYGDAVRQGAAAATKEFLALVDSGTQLAPADVERMAMLAPRCDLVCGCRVERTGRLLGRVASKAYSLTADALLGTHVRDCNGAVKLMRREAFARLDPRASSRFVHAELLAAARLLGMLTVALDVSQRTAPARQRRFSIRASWGMCRELLSFWWKTVLFPAADVTTDSARAKTSAVRAWHVALFSGVAALVLLTRLNFPLIEPDEARYALIAAHMIDSGDWVIPWREGAYYLDKPPLLYWLTLASFELFGMHDYAARVVTALAALGTLAAVYFIGRRLVGERGALLGALMLLMSLGFVLAGRFLLMDGLLTLFTTISILALYAATQGPRLRIGWWATASIACGLGVMTKGPVALVIALPPLIAVRWLNREAAKISLRAWASFAGGITAIAIPWFVAATLRDPGFLKYFFWDHHVKRFTTDFNHVEAWWFYLPVLALGMFPASFLLPILGVYVFRRAPAVRATRSAAQGYLLLASLWVVAFFSISSGKLATYILPSLPPLALLLGAMLDGAILAEIPDAFMARMRRWIPFHGTRVALLVGIAVGVAVVVIDRSSFLRWIESALLIAGSAALYWYVSRPAFAARPARWWAAAAIPLSLLGVGMIDIYPTIATQRSLARQVSELQSEIRDIDSTICFGIYEDSLVFYSPDHNVVLFNVAQLDEIRDYLKAHGRVLILSQVDYIPNLQQHLGPDVRIAEQPHSRGKLFLATVAHTDDTPAEVSAGRADDARR